MKSLIQFLTPLLIGLVLITSCSKDDNNNDTPPEIAKLQIQEKLDEINVPENLANSQTFYAIQVNLYVLQIKSITNYFAFFDPIEGAEYDDGTYFWSYGGQSVWMDYSESSDAYVYKMDVDFGSGRVNYITSEQNKGGTSGWMKIYDFTGSMDDNEFLYEYSWVINSDGSVVIEQSNFSDNYLIEISGNPNDSGYAKYYDNGLLEYEFVWNSDGSGYYKSYDDSGNEKETDSWTVDDL